MSARLALYSAVDEALTHYEVDVEAATLTPRATVQLPAKVQYAWPHPLRPLLYVTASSAGPRTQSADNYLSTLAIGADGTLTALEPVAPLPRRAVHLCLDPQGRYVLNAHNFPSSALTVHRLTNDGRVGPEIVQDPALPCGTYPHQVRVFPSGRTALIVDRGNKAQEGRAEQPGALRSLRLDDGILTPAQVVAPNAGYGFGPRHAAFHPTKPWMYVSDERTNRLYMFRFDSNDVMELEPAFTCDSLDDPANVRPRQIAGPIHVHPEGHTVYVANRADHCIAHGQSQVFSGGENNIAVFAIDPGTGQPRPVQHAPVQAFHVRTFACSPCGRLLISASIKALDTLEGDRIIHVPAALSVFRIEDDGRLTFVRKYDVPTSGTQLHYWMGVLALP